MEPSYLCDQRLQTIDPEHTILIWKISQSEHWLDKDRTAD